MARGRFISNTLGDSERFCGLQNDTHRCAYMLLVTYADAEGRFNADPITLKGKLYTRLDWTTDTVTQALADMHHVGLVNLYAVDGKHYGVIIKFHEHNTIRRKDDGSPKEEAPTRIPAPPDGFESHPGTTPVPEPYRSDTGTTLAKGKGKGKGKDEVEVTNTSASPTRTHEHQPYVEAWNEHCGNLPTVRTLDAKRKRALDQLQKEHGHEALALFTAATMHVASDDFWIERGYGIDNLLRPGRVLEKAEKWRSAPGLTSNNRKTANIATAIARAIGGLDA